MEPVEGFSEDGFTLVTKGHRLCAKFGQLAIDSAISVSGTKTGNDDFSSETLSVKVTVARRSLRASKEFLKGILRNIKAVLDRGMQLAGRSC